MRSIKYEYCTLSVSFTRRNFFKVITKLLSLFIYPKLSEALIQKNQIRVLDIWLKPLKFFLFSNSPALL